MTPEKLKHVAWIAVKAVLRAQRLQVHANETACSAIAVEAVGPIDPPGLLASCAAYLTGDRMRETFPTGTYKTRTKKSEVRIGESREDLVFYVAGWKAVVSFTPINDELCRGVWAVVEGVVKEEERCLTK